MNITPQDLAELVKGGNIRHINVVVDDVQSVADAITPLLPNVVHIGLGGRVSQGRNADVLPDEVIDLSADEPLTVLVEIYPDYSPTLLAEYLKFILDTKLPDGVTVVLLNTGKSLRSGTWVLPLPILNKLVTIGVTLEPELA